MITALPDQLVSAYLHHLDASAPSAPTHDALVDLMDRHLRRVPFENLDVYFQRGVDVDPVHSARKVAEQGRGGWCFELNGAFAALLIALGYEVKLLGAAVLLNGPNRIVDHLTLEVTTDRPHLVDVGFGDCFIRPLPLNAGGDIDGGNGTFAFMPSPEGTTLVRMEDDGPHPLYRFRRVALSMEDLRPASDRLYHDPDSHFRQGPVVSRLIGDGADRVTLLTDRLRFTSDGGQRDEVVADQEAWDRALDTWFGIGAGTDA